MIIRIGFPLGEFRQVLAAAVKKKSPAFSPLANCAPRQRSFFSFLKKTRFFKIELMSSRFFHSGGGSDSDSDYSSSSLDSSRYSDSEELSSADESLSDAGVVESKQQQTQAQSAFSRFLRDELDSDSDDLMGGKRVVKSAMQKFRDELRLAIKTIDEAKQDKDFALIQKEFDRMTKTIGKALATLIRDSGYPRFYIRCLVELEDFLGESFDKKGMNAINAKALTAMRQKIRKTNKAISEEIEAFRENPSYQSDEDELDESEVDEDESEISEAESEAELTGFDKWKKSSSVEKKTFVKKQRTVKAKKELEDQEGKEDTSKRAELEISADTLHTRLCEVLEARGKKATDKLQQLEILEKLLEVAATPVHKLKVLLTLISARLDFNLKATSLEMWKNCESEIKQVMTLLETHENIMLDEQGEGWEEDREYTGENQKYSIRGNVVSFLNRLNEEFLKSLQNTDAHTMDYVDRLKDEVPLYGLIARIENYCVSRNEINNVVLLRIMRLEHIYYKPNDITRVFEEKICEKNSSLPKFSGNVDEMIQGICVYLYKNAPDRIRTRALLCHVYHHALNKRYYEARDLLLMSHLQETIQETDISTQILYNRALAQIGICALRLGLIKESHDALHDIMASLKSKDVLAQGTMLSRYHTSAEAEKQEKIRVLPFHMHINLELLESIQLIASMLLEIPNLAAFSSDSKNKIISRHFRRLFEIQQQQVFTGPPESYRDYIMQAAMCLNEGDWKTCNELLTSVKSLDLLPDAKSVREIITEKLKSEAMRTFLFHYKAYFENISIDLLTQKFELGEPKVRAILNRMIYNKEISARIDDTNGIVQLLHDEKAKLDIIVGQYMEKLNSLAEANDNLYEFKLPQSQKKATDDRKHYHSGKRPHHQTRSHRRKQ